MELIFDIGFHKGEDTRRYLSAGYRVVAVEANPLLARAGAERFAAFVAAGRLTLLNAGLSDREGVQEFWINHARSEWSSFDPAMGGRGRRGSHCAQVSCLTIAALFERYGIPHYLKIDIEGNDHVCLRGLVPGRLPRYASCEASDLSWLELLREKGYTKFKMINQFDGFRAFDARRERSALSGVRSTLLWHVRKLLGDAARFPAGSSGPFGEATDGSWCGFEGAAQAYRAFYAEGGVRLNGRSWFDFHATY